MSTIVRTPFGNYETWSDGRMFSISPELQRVIGYARPRNRQEMERLLSGLRSRYNSQLRDSRNAAEQNRIRMEKQIADLQLQLANGIRNAQQSANENSRRRIAEVEQRSNQRLQEAQRRSSERMARMQEQTRRQLETLRTQQAKAINNLEKRVYNDMANMHAQLDSRIDVLGDNITAIQNDLLGRISDTNQRIDATNKHVDLVQKGLNDLTGYVGEMEERIDANFRQQEQEIQSVQNEVRNIQNELAKIDSRGTERAQLALALMDEVEKNNNLDRFVQAEAERVRRRMATLANTGASGAELSAAANEAMINIVELEINCNRERMKYEQQEELTRTMIEAVLETVNKLREIELTDDEGTPVTVENNFWSRGRYNELKEHLESLKNEVETRSNTDLTVERLEEIQKEIVQAEIDIQSITSQSVAQVHLSQARMQAVSDIIGVMEEQQWEVIEKNGVEEIDYAGGETVSDYREGAFVRMQNDLGEEVTVIVEPTEDGSKNTLGFHFSGGHNILTDEESERRAEAVARQIEQSGYEVGKPKCAGHMAMPEMDSAEAMTSVGAAQRIRERVNG